MDTYQKKYEEALERAKTYPEYKDILASIFPELKESEDDRIRKEIIQFLQLPHPQFVGKRNHEEWIAWLEKQGYEGKKWIYEDVYIKEKEQVFQDGVDEVLENPQKYGLEKQGEKKEIDYGKELKKCRDNPLYFFDKYVKIKLKEQNPANKVEPKFKVGDWVVREYNNSHTVNQVIKVEHLDDEFFGYHLDDKTYFSGSWENSYHLWTIKDAKDGDVLTTKNFIFIFKNIDNDNGVRYYCLYEISNNEEDDLFEVAFPHCVMGRVDNGLSYYSPATEEQCNLLFSKMKEAGYEWDSEKRKLRKLE